MLLRFSVKGYKMYLGEATLSMEAAPKQKDLEYSLLREKVAGKERKGICSAVIYGPNAAGKSALVSALNDFKGIVERGSISTIGAGRDLSLIPSSVVETVRPVSLEVSFTKNGTLYEYSLEANLGRFAHAKDARHIVGESLLVNGMKVFERQVSEVTLFVPDKIESQFSQKYLENRTAANELLSPVDPEDLFIANSFRTLVSPSIANEVLSWFAVDLLVVPRANDAAIYPRDPVRVNSEFLGAHFSEVSRLFGTAPSDALVFLEQKNADEPARLFTSVSTKEGRIAVPSDLYESLGTMRFLNMLPFVEVALAEGKVLVMDELDASIHPMAVMSIVNAFHDDAVNVNGAQLVFTTHNPILLDSNLFRRDEIKFVERDEISGESVTYALSDFGTAGSRGVRRGEDYQRGYFMGRYGAIRDIDLVPFLKKQVERGLHMDLTPEGNGSIGQERELVTNGASDRSAV